MEGLDIEGRRTRSEVLLVKATIWAPLILLQPLQNDGRNHIIQWIEFTPPEGFSNTDGGNALQRRSEDKAIGIQLALPNCLLDLLGIASTADRYEAAFCGSNEPSEDVGRQCLCR